MGLFSPKATQAQMQHAQTLLKQLQESAKLVNTTLKVQVFFARLNFVFDILLELQQYEKYNFIVGEPPSRSYNMTLGKLEYTVNDFIERVFKVEYLSVECLSTEKSRINHVQKLIESLKYGFDNANTFCKGNASVHRHYTGNLYTQTNLSNLKIKCNEIYFKYCAKKTSTSEKKAIELKENNTLDAFEKSLDDARVLSSRRLFGITLKNCKTLRTNLVEAEFFFSCSSAQALYRGRIFCIDGSSRLFPMLTQEIIDCGLEFNPFVYQYSEPNIYSFLPACKMDITAFSNRPFVDDRTAEEKSNFNKFLLEELEKVQKENDRTEYNKIVFSLPTIAPKTFGAYRRMKKQNTKTYVEIIKQAKIANII